MSRGAFVTHDVGNSGVPGLANIDYCRTLECSVPGPQVRTRPRQLDVANFHGFVSKQPVNLHRVASPQPQSHIYMEVDPLYSSFQPGQQMMMGEPQYLEAGQSGGLVSSTSSQTSSGYSSAPSDSQQKQGNMSEYDTTEYEDNSRVFPTSQDMLASTPLATKDCVNRIYSISQQPFHHQTRTSQKQNKSELVMNNILLQQTNREVL